MTHEDSDPATAILNAVRGLRNTPVGERLASRSFRREHTAQALLANPDPIMQEIGRQLRDGTMDLADVLRHPDYADAFRAAAAQALERLDPQEVAQQMTDLAERAHADDPATGPDAPRRPSW